MKRTIIDISQDQPELDFDEAALSDIDDERVKTYHANRPPRRLARQALPEA
jgi:hypothetical protein